MGKEILNLTSKRATCKGDIPVRMHKNIIYYYYYYYYIIKLLYY